MSELIDRDWSEDFAHENGNYSNRCVICGQLFNGHKRRVECKVCMTEFAGVIREADIFLDTENDKVKSYGVTFEWNAPMAARFAMKKVDKAIAAERERWEKAIATVRSRYPDQTTPGWKDHWHFDYMRLLNEVEAELEPNTQAKLNTPGEDG